MSDDIIHKISSLLPNCSLHKVSQGAEAVVFTTPTHPYLPREFRPENSSYIVKFRPPKPYRHPQLESALTRRRTIGEAKMLHRLGLLGVHVPKLVALDAKNGVIWMEYVCGNSRVRELQAEEKSDPNSGFSEFKIGDSLKSFLWFYEFYKNGLHAESDPVNSVIHSVGYEIGKLHISDVIHGDLTTSNVIIRDTRDSSGNWVSEPFLIDFGLAGHSGLPEDKAVDLYVLERALLSTHSQYSALYGEWMLQGYREAHEAAGKAAVRGCKETLKKLEEVRLRGRKRSMVG